MTALNEQDNITQAITQMHQALSSCLRDFCIVVIDDGSSDETYARAKEMDLTNLLVIKNSTNLGTGQSIRAYLPHIKSEFYCWYPTDLELSPFEITKLIEKANGQDIVASYLVGDERASARKMLSKTFTHILNLSFGMDLPYYNGVSLIKTSLLPASHLISSKRFFTHAEILLLSINEEVKLTSVGLHLFPRASGESKAMRLNAFWDVGINYLRLVSKKMRS